MPLVRKDTTGLTTAPGATTDGLRSASADERFAAARDMAGQAAAVPALAAALASESDPRVREAILTGLARVGDSRAAEVIIPLIGSGDASVRTAALDALRLMPQAVTEHLGGLLKDPDPDIRLLACELARNLPGPVATRLMGELLREEDQENVCASALDVLAEVGGPEALPVLALCQARFAETPFLAFALRVTTDRINAKPPS